MDNNNQQFNNYNNQDLNHKKSKVGKIITWLIVILIVIAILLIIFNSAYNNGSYLINS